MYTNSRILINIHNFGIILCIDKLLMPALPVLQILPNRFFLNNNMKDR